jgi:hypothetical protein
MGKNRSNAEKHLQEQEDEEEKNKKVHVAHYKDYAACVQLLHQGIDDKSRLSNIDSDIIICEQQSICGHDAQSKPPSSFHKLWVGGGEGIFVHCDQSFKIGRNLNLKNTELLHIEEKGRQPKEGPYELHLSVACVISS